MPQAFENLNSHSCKTDHQAEAKKKARLERFGSGQGQEKKPAEDPSVLASKLAARAERFALSKSGTQPAPGTAASAATPQASKAPTNVQERDAAAVAKAAALVKPAANPEAEAKRQVSFPSFNTW